MNRHSTVGVDLVNHCVNDISVHGAAPLFLLDYLATGKMHPAVVTDVVRGVASACRSVGCALIGGETAEMPGFYADGEYDLAGFIVGTVDRDKMVTGAGIKPGDVLIGLPSTGLHTNGYSLARKLLFEVGGYKPTQYVTAIKEKAGAALLRTHRSYLHVIQKLVTGVGIKAGDVLIGMPSTGLHTNGYSLARKLLFEVGGYKPTQYVTAIREKAGAALLRTHRSYLHVIQKLVTAGMTTGMAHITGGGITENLPRILPKAVTAQVEIGSWPVLPIFEHLRELGNVPQEEMMRTFNMGIGLIAAIPAAKFTRAKNLLDRAEEKFYVVGRVVKGERRVQYT